MERIRAHSAAKLNLRLKVTGRIEDKTSPFLGYHTLSMLNVPLKFADQVEVTISPEDPEVRISVSGPSGRDVPTDSRNLVWRALDLLFHEAGERFGVTVHLEKHVPAGAGCGGGSGNAATALRIVNTHLPTPLDEKQLLTVAARVGADVPYFLRVAPAWVGGIGDKVEYSTSPEYLRGLECLLFLGLPPLSTIAVYHRLKQITQSFLPDPIQTFPTSYQALLALIENDLEMPASALCLPLGQILQKLRERFGTRRAGVTGSGSALFVLAPEEGGFTQDELMAAEQLAQSFGAHLKKTAISW